MHGLTSCKSQLWHGILPPMELGSDSDGMFGVDLGKSHSKSRSGLFSLCFLPEGS